MVLFPPWFTFLATFWQLRFSALLPGSAEVQKGNRAGCNSQHGRVYSSVGERVHFILRIDSLKKVNFTQIQTIDEMCFHINS